MTNNWNWNVSPYQIIILTIPLNRHDWLCPQSSFVCSRLCSCLCSWKLSFITAEQRKLFLLVAFSVHFSVCFIPLCLTLITGLGACSLYLCRYLSPEPFALCAFNCLLMGVGPRAASAVGNEPSLTGLAFQQPLCPLRGFSVAVHSLTQGY